MPLQNRVTPFGEIVATPERGLFTGNRGIIHDPSTRTLLGRRWATKAWIICSCSYKNVRRDVMARHSWTELFFLDEATALAAGHRPCFLCRRDAALAFRNAWTEGNGGAPPYAADIDRVLHRERLDGRKKRVHPATAPTAKLPDGTMVANGEASYLVLRGTLRLWSAAGYREGPASVEKPRLLTPPSTVFALSAGYRPVIHPTA
jgi:hypothetical protein